MNQEETLEHNKVSSVRVFDMTRQSGDQLHQLSLQLPLYQ